MRVDQSTQPAIEAATVMLVRDRASVEVFLLERHIDSDFVGGAWVFPGGKVDEADAWLPPSALAGHPPAALAEHVGDGSATALCVAAIRETFEESGVLLAHRTTGPVTAADLRSDSYLAARSKLADRNSKWDWSGWLADERLRLDLTALVWWSWWVTPMGVHRRFDTKFFVATLPESQVAVHDNIETTNSRWARPVMALQAAKSGSVSIILPTRMNLQKLAGYPSTTSIVVAGTALDFARPRIEPRLIIGDDGQVLVDHESFDHPEPV
ncbi:MAG: NUDIX hydrolase [Acidimicrobiia bacterium]|nr:NUDIX hydrolase [Acidimicrobiia bacterium]MDH5505279.1 NUDIX hydrolase [Acidimicrobiia bacterium]